MEITKKLIKSLKRMALKYSNNNDDCDDAVQDALRVLLQMPKGHERSFYFQACDYEIRHSLKKSRAYTNRTTVGKGKPFKDYIDKAPWLYQGGNVNVSSKGGRNSPIKPD